MKKKRTTKKLHFFCALILILVCCIMPVNVYAWTDQAHMAMGLAAGFSGFHNCPAADISRTVATINGLTQNDLQAHFFNVPDDYVLSVDDVYNQLNDIGKSKEECPEGYLLGAILNTTRLCKERTESGAYDDEYYAVLLHYVADFVQPLHLSPYDEFNQKYHFECDHILTYKEAEYPVLAAIALADEIAVNKEMAFETEEDLAEAIIDLAKQTQLLAKAIRDEQRVITREEAIKQLSSAATLGNAIMRYCGKIKGDDPVKVGIEW